MASDKDMDCDTGYELLLEKYLQGIQDEVDQDIASKGWQPSVRKSVTWMTGLRDCSDGGYIGKGFQKGAGLYKSELHFRGIGGTTSEENEVAGLLADTHARNMCIIPVPYPATALEGCFFGALQPKEVEDENEFSRSPTDNMWRLHSAFADTYQPTRSGPGNFLEGQMVTYPKENNEENRSDSSDLIELYEDDSPEVDEAFNSIPARTASKGLIIERSPLYATAKTESPSAILVWKDCEEGPPGRIITDDTNNRELGKHQGSDHEDEPLEFQDLIQYLERKKLELAGPQVRAKIKGACEAALVENEEACHGMQTTTLAKPVAPEKLRPIDIGKGRSHEDVKVHQIPDLERLQTLLENPHTSNACMAKTSLTNRNIGSPNLSGCKAKEITGKNSCFKPEVEKCAALKHATMETQSLVTSLSVKHISSTHKGLVSHKTQNTLAPGSKRTKDRKARRIRAAKRALAEARIPNHHLVNSSIKTSKTPEKTMPELGNVEKSYNREVRIVNLPPGIPLKIILSKVRGGLLDRACYRKGLHTIMIVFFEPLAALSFCRHLQKFPLKYPTSHHPGAPLRLVDVIPPAKLPFEPRTQGKNQAVLDRGATRCLFIGFLPDNISIKKIEGDIMDRLEKLERKSRYLEASDELIESIEVIVEPEKLKRTPSAPLTISGRKEWKSKRRKSGMCVIVRLASISLAFGAIKDFRSRPEYLGVELAFVEDECAGSLVPPVTVTTAKRGKGQKPGNGR